MPGGAVAAVGAARKTRRPSAKRNSQESIQQQFHLHLNLDLDGNDEGTLRQLVLRLLYEKNPVQVIAGLRAFQPVSACRCFGIVCFAARDFAVFLFFSLFFFFNIHRYPCCG